MRIATPCHEDWNRMDPRRSGRHCAACDRTVIDLTALGSAERRARLAAIAGDVRSGGQVCVRGAGDRDGALAGSRRALNGGMAMLLAMTMAGCLGEGPQLGHAAATPAHATRPADLPETSDPTLVPMIEPVALEKLEMEPDIEESPYVLGEMNGTDVQLPPVPEVRTTVLLGAIACPPRDPRMPSATN